MEFIYLQKGGKINGKSAPKDNDENAIPTKEEGGTDMNPKFTKKLKPKQTAKPSPIYKSKTKTEKVEEKKKGGKMRKKCSCGCAMKISKNAKGGLIETCACGCNMKKVAKGENGLKTKQVKPTTNDSIQAHNRLNAGESESGKGPQTKQEVINRLRKGNFGPGNTKAAFDKELKNKK